MVDYVVVKSAAIRDRDLLPRVATNAGLMAGERRGFASTLEVTTTVDIAASVFVFGQIPTNAYNVEVVGYWDDLGTNTAADVGLWRNTSLLIPNDADGRAVTTTIPTSTATATDQDFFASAVVLGTANTTGTNLTHESGVYGVEDVEKPLWEAVGATVDPGGFYDLCVAVTAAADGTGTLTLKVGYQV